MKEGIHPNYKEVEARCACGNTFKTRSTKPELHLEICSNCHPFFTGRQKLIDTEGRVERFTKKFGLQTSEQRKTAAKAVYNSAVLEQVAQMALLTEQINPNAPRLKGALIEKHFERKHGPDSYYGQ